VRLFDLRSSSRTDASSAVSALAAQLDLKLSSSAGALRLMQSSSNTQLLSSAMDGKVGSAVPAIIMQSLASRTIVGRYDQICMWDLRFPTTSPMLVFSGVQSRFTAVDLAPSRDDKLLFAGTVLLLVLSLVIFWQACA